MSRYRSKVDIWLIVVVWVVIVLPTLPVIVEDMSIAVIAIDTLILLFVTALLVSVSYDINGETLTVRCCYVMKETYRITDIIEIKKSRTIMSAPASSLDRLELKIGRKTLIISPCRKSEFVAELMAINPDIRLAGPID